MHSNTEIQSILRGIHHEICDFKQLYRMDRESKLPSDETVELTRRVLEAVERAVRGETRAHLWKLVSQLYKAQYDSDGDDEEFAEACVEMQEAWLESGDNILIWNAAVEIFDNQTQGKPFTIAPTLDAVIEKLMKPA